MKNSQYNFLKIIIIILAILGISFFFSLNKSTKEAEIMKEQTLLSLNCNPSKFEIRGEIYNGTTAWAVYDYKYRLSLYLNDALIQEDEIAKRFFPPLLEFYADKYKLYTTYFLPMMTLKDMSSHDSRMLMQYNLSIYVPSEKFSESEYKSLVNCIGSNRATIVESLNKTRTIKPSLFFSEQKEHPVTTLYDDVLMITYGEPYANIVMECSATQAGWMATINPSGLVWENDTKTASGASLGNITLVNGKEVWSSISAGILEKGDYEYLKTCQLPSGEKFFEKYPPSPNIDFEEKL